jgi:hypothetical protein
MLLVLQFIIDIVFVCLLTVSGIALFTVHQATRYPLKNVSFYLTEIYDVYSYNFNTVRGILSKLIYSLLPVYSYSLKQDGEPVLLATLHDNSMLLLVQKEPGVA